jgi:hypothetical protein
LLLSSEKESNMMSSGTTTTTNSSSTPLTDLARKILYPKTDDDGGGSTSSSPCISDLEFALTFLPQAGVDSKIVGTSLNDRLIKTARMMIALFDTPPPTSSTDPQDQNDLLPNLAPQDIETSLQRLVQDFTVLSSIADSHQHVPRVPFGKTGILMPIVTIGCMRFQMAWGDRIQNFNQIEAGT